MTSEATAYDKKLMLERKDPTSWLKSVSAFANTQGGILLFGVANADVRQELDLRKVISLRRNPVIADLFQRLELMERRGSGFKKILDAYAFESEKRLNRRSEASLLYLNWSQQIPHSS